MKKEDIPTNNVPTLFPQIPPLSLAIPGSSGIFPGRCLGGGKNGF